MLCLFLTKFFHTFSRNKQKLSPYLRDDELVNDAPLPVVNGDLVRRNRRRREASGRGGDSDRRLELRRRRFAAELRRIEAMARPLARREFPGERRLGREKVGGIAGNEKLHCWSVFGSLSAPVWPFLVTPEMGRG